MESKHADSDSEDSLPSKSTQRTQESKVSSNQEEEPYDLDTSVASKLCDYLYMDDNLTDLIEEYVESNSKDFADAEPNDGSDHSLEHMSMYKKYTSLVESNLEEFGKSIDLTPRELMKNLSDAVGSKGDLSSGENLSSAIIALTSFSEFVKMMREFVIDGTSPCICPPLLNEKGELEFE